MSNDSNDSGAAKKFDVETYWENIKGKWSKRAEPIKIGVNNHVPKANFKRDLAKGQNSEHSFFMKYQSCLVRTDGRRGDFEILKTSELVELKSDFYNHDDTSNFFIERYSSGDKNGGPWQSKEHKVDYYIYWFPLSGHIYVFNLNQLIRKLEKLTKKLELVSVRNEGFITRGYKVPRESLQTIFLTPEEIGLYGD